MTRQLRERIPSLAQHITLWMGGGVGRGGGGVGLGGGTEANLEKSGGEFLKSV